MLTAKLLRYIVETQAAFEHLSAERAWDDMSPRDLIRQGRQVVLANVYRDTTSEPVPYFKNFLITRQESNYKFHLIMSRPQRSQVDGVLIEHGRVLLYKMEKTTTDQQPHPFTTKVVTHVHNKTCGKAPIYGINKLAYSHLHLPGANHLLSKLN